MADVQFTQFRVGYRNYDNPQYPNGMDDVMVVDASTCIEALNKGYDLLAAKPNGHPKSVANIAEPILGTAITQAEK